MENLYVVPIVKPVIVRFARPCSPFADLTLIRSLPESCSIVPEFAVHKSTSACESKFPVVPKISEPSLASDALDHDPEAAT